MRQIKATKGTVDRVHDTSARAYKAATILSRIADKALAGAATHSNYSAGMSKVHLHPIASLTILIPTSAVSLAGWIPPAGNLAGSLQLEVR